MAERGSLCSAGTMEDILLWAQRHIQYADAEVPQLRKGSWKPAAWPCRPPSDWRCVYSAAHPCWPLWSKGSCRITIRGSRRRRRKERLGKSNGFGWVADERNTGLIAAQGARGGCKARANSVIGRSSVRDHMCYNKVPGEQALVTSLTDLAET